METSVAGERAYAYTGSRPFVPEQPSIVFVHGGGLEHSVWVLQSRYFAHHGYNALAVDLPGHGRSGGEVCASVEAYADWVAAFLDAVGVEQADVCGHSMGSLVALETAARHPARVSRLAMLGTSVPMPVTDQLLDAAKRNDHSAFDMINIWGHSPFGQMGGNRAPGMWMIGGSVRLLERSAPGGLFNDLSACNDYRHGVESAGQVRCPALLLLGARDAMSPPRAAQAVASALPDARTVVLPGCGHMMMSEQPDQVLEALVSFLNA